MYSCLRVAEVVRRRLEEEVEVMMELEVGKEVNRDNGAREEDWKEGDRWKDEGDDDGGGSRRSGSQSNSSLSTSCFISFTGQ